MLKSVLMCLLGLPVAASATATIDQRVMFFGFPNNTTFTNKPISFEYEGYDTKDKHGRYPLVFPPNDPEMYPDEQQYYMSCTGNTVGIGHEDDYNCHAHFVTEIAWVSSGISHQCSVDVQLVLEHENPMYHVGHDANKTHNYSTTGDCTSSSNKEGNLIWYFTPK